MPTVAPADALSSTWFCAAGTGWGSTEARTSGLPGPGGTAPTSTTTSTTTTTTTAPGPPGTTAAGAPPPAAPIVAEHTVIISNQSDRTEHVRITVFGAAGTDPSFTVPDPVTKTIDVAARTRTDVRLSDILQAPYVSALVETDGGLLAVAHELVGPTGTGTGPCASSASSSWTFPVGTTHLGARQVFVAFNPFPQQAVLDFGFEVDEGGHPVTRQTDKLRGLVVPPGHTVAIDITDIIQVRSQIATTVTTRSGVGRVVVDQLVVADGSGKQPAQLSVMLGAPDANRAWAFTDGRAVDDGVSTTYVVYNPGPNTVTADLVINVDAANTDIEPYTVTVRPGEYATIPLDQDTRVPTKVGYWAAVRSRTDDPIVVGRIVVASGKTAPGVEYSIGTPLAATDWLVARAGLVAGSDPAAGAVSMAVANLSSTDTVMITISAVADGTTTVLPAYDHVTLAPGDRTIVAVDAQLPGADPGRSLRVTSSGPVTVTQSTASGGDDPSLSGFAGYPVRGTESPLPADLVDRTATTTTLVVPPLTGGTEGTVPGTGTSEPGSVPETTSAPTSSDSSTPGTEAPTTATPGTDETTTTAAPAGQ
jgi:hypothetical protein